MKSQILTYTYFQKCIPNTNAVAACACFKALTSVDPKCEDLESVNKDILDKSKKCISSTEAGSFAACRKSEQAAAYLVNKCKVPGSVVTTKVISTTRVYPYLNHSVVIF